VASIPNIQNVDNTRGRTVRLAGLVAVSLLALTASFSAGAWIVPHLAAGPELANPQPHPFQDLVTGSALTDAIDRVWHSGLMRGTGPGTFEPNRTATRGEAAVVLVRCARGADYEPEPVETPPGAHANAHWAIGWLTAAGDLGLMDRSAVVQADWPITRADLASLLATCMELKDS